MRRPLDIVRLAAALLAAGVLSLPLAAAPAVDQKEACGTCHEQVEEAAAARIQHLPAAEGECTACHNPHVSRFADLLLDRPGPLCATCHDDLGQALERTFVHEPVADGRCVDCHDSHGGDRDHLLTRDAEALCSDCHAEVADWAARPVQHAPFAGGDCAECHDPHASDYQGLATRAGTEVCTSCHEVDLSFRTAHSGYPVEQRACQECHDPHASETPGLFRRSVHLPFTEGRCVDCHALPASNDPFRLKQPMARLCGDCHEDAVTASLESPFPHVSGGGADCGACHNPHSADGDALLRGEQEELCVSCHDPGGASSGHEGRFLSHGEMACTGCHAPHGAGEPVLLARNNVDLCGDCHSHQHTVVHPMGEGSRDPRTGQEMDCLSCHSMHDAPYEDYMYRAPERDLCLACHTERQGTLR